MVDSGDKKKKRATYRDVLKSPRNTNAEIVDGDLYLSPRPGIPHAIVETHVQSLLGAPFDNGDDGPGGWIILHEPELRFGRDVLVPDVGGWRRERMPHVPHKWRDAPAPDWICEVLSKRTERYDRGKKMRVYARAGVQYAWLLKPVIQTLEVFRLLDGRWSEPATYVGNVKARVQPFDALELDLARLWRDLPPLPQPTRASDGALVYEYEFERDESEIQPCAL